MNKIIISLSLIFTLLSSCGYQKLNNLENRNYKMDSVQLDGDKRIGYQIKNIILLSSSKESNNAIDISLDISKTKNIKEKSETNTITKYNLVLNIAAKIDLKKHNKSIENIFSQSSDFTVAENHSDTLANEKKALEFLSEKVAEDIVNVLNLTNK